MAAGRGLREVQDPAEIAHRQFVVLEHGKQADPRQIRQDRQVIEYLLGGGYHEPASYAGASCMRYIRVSGWTDYMWDGKLGGRVVHDPPGSAREGFSLASRLYQPAPA